jgi:DUF4097 and DUF4098 domain-containing protein YvlB
MKKQEFINELKRELAQAPSHIRDEILADISEHFSEGISQGMSEEEICRSLGQPGAIAAQVLEEYNEGRTFNQNDNGSSGFEQAFDGIGKAFDSIGKVFNDFTQQFNETSGDEIDIDRSFTNIQNINIKLADSKIRFVPSADGNCRVTMRGRMRNRGFTINDEGGSLVIADQSQLFMFNFFRFKSTLVTTVYVPAQFRGELKVRSAAGNISAADTNGQINFKAAAGNITVENHRASSIRISTAAGNAAVHLANGRTESIDISTAAGNAKITAEETGRLTLNSAAGSVDAEINRLFGDTKIETAAGSVKITAYEVAGNINISTAAGSVKVHLPVDVNCRINVKKPALGSLSNELAGNPDSPYTLRASSGVGSIRLKRL